MFETFFNEVVRSVWWFLKKSVPQYNSRPLSVLASGLSEVLQNSSKLVTRSVLDRLCRILIVSIQNLFREVHVSRWVVKVYSNSDRWQKKTATATGHDLSNREVLLLPSRERSRAFLDPTYYTSHIARCTLHIIQFTHYTLHTTHTSTYIYQFYSMVSFVSSQIELQYYISVEKYI